MIERRGATTRERGTGEEATAAAEFAILLPVYLLLFVTLFTLGQLVLIRQKVVLAARLQAWLNHGPGNIGTAVFPGFQAYGSYTGTLQMPPGFSTGSAPGADPNDFLGVNGQVDFKPSESEYRSRVNEDPPRDAKNRDAASQLAQLIFFDATQDSSGQNVTYHPHLEWRGATASFSYAPPWIPSFIGRTQAISPNWTCLVLGRKLQDSSGNPIERKVFRPSSAGPDPAGTSASVNDHDPIEDYQAGWSDGSQVALVSFPISKEPQQNAPGGRFFPPDLPANEQDPNGNPLFPNESNVSLQPGNIDATVPSQSSDSDQRDVGLWNTGLRLGGDPDAEHDFFATKEQ
jgi:hypothetical protein